MMEILSKNNLSKKKTIKFMFYIPFSCENVFLEKKAKWDYRQFRSIGNCVILNTQNLLLKNCG